MSGPPTKAERIAKREVSSRAGIRSAAKGWNLALRRTAAGPIPSHLVQPQDEIVRLTARYDRRQTSDGFVVFDLWTGETVVISGVVQDDLSSLDSEDLVRMLNERAAAGMRDLLQ